jgi:MFS family permease
MLSLLKRRSYRVILTANFISLIGSGLNHAAIIWFVLDRTKSESMVALLVTVITLPSLFFIPFSGVLIDRLDRRYTTIALDVVRGLAVAAVSLLAITGHVQVWHVYAMGVVLGLGAFMFWSNISALTQEFVEGQDVVPVNAMVMGGAQAGWALAGSVVGFLYAHIGLGGLLALDASSYAISAALMYTLRHGKHLVRHEGIPGAPDPAAPFSLRAFNRDFREGLRYVFSQRRVLLLGSVSSLFTAGMMSQNVLTAPLNMKILNTGAAGFGYCNAGWSLGAILASGYAGSKLRHGPGILTALWMALLLGGVACVASPYARVLALVVFFYFLMGAGRGIGGIGVSSGLMHEVPKPLMGRTQNVFTFVGIALQLVLTMGVGWLSEHVSLALGFAFVGSSYFAASLLAWIVAREPAPPAVPPGEEELVFPHAEPAEL